MSTDVTESIRISRSARNLVVSDHCPENLLPVVTNVAGSVPKNQGWCLHDFKLEKQLGVGSASVVFRALHYRSGRIVALKLYIKSRMSRLNEHQVQREVVIHSRLRHQNIISMYGAFEDRNHVVLILEYAGKGDLFDLLKNIGGRMREKDVARRVMVPFLYGVTYLHDQGIVHRDIKLENTLFTSDGVLKIADFGLSIDMNLEVPVTRLGTLDCMSPEVLACPDKRDPYENKEKTYLAYGASADAWACGVLMYELMNGCPPFGMSTREASITAIMKNSPKIPSWMPDLAKDFIQAALNKSPSKRLTAKQLMRHPWIQSYMSKAPAMKSQACQTRGLLSKYVHEHEATPAIAPTSVTTASSASVASLPTIKPEEAMTTVNQPKSIAIPALQLPLNYEKAPIEGIDIPARPQSVSPSTISEVLSTPMSLKLQYASSATSNSYTDTVYQAQATIEEGKTFDCPKLSASPIEPSLPTRPASPLPQSLCHKMAAHTPRDQHDAPPRCATPSMPFMQPLNLNQMHLPKQFTSEYYARGGLLADSRFAAASRSFDSPPLSFVEMTPEPPVMAPQGLAPSYQLPPQSRSPPPPPVQGDLVNYSITNQLANLNLKSLGQSTEFSLSSEHEQKLGCWEQKGGFPFAANILPGEVISRDNPLSDSLPEAISGIVGSMASIYSVPETNISSPTSTQVSNGWLHESCDRLPGLDRNSMANRSIHATLSSVVSLQCVSARSDQSLSSMRNQVLAPSKAAQPAPAFACHKHSMTSVSRSVASFGVYQRD